ncbi:EAL domain-containing protein [Sphingomonas sanguinis]|uniref:EAL domain-containing protein n=1 Tax=Sphingomonas sanguinis TaxID=33051 RepID=UPI0009EE390A|nr:EAL domain-containing protein [Sphingomonas sanguinis]
MNGSPPHSPRLKPRGGGPGDGPAAIQLGFVAEPVVELARDGSISLYSECLARIMVAGSVLLKPGDFVADLETGGHIALLDTAMVELVLDALAADPHVRLGCNISPLTLADADRWAWLIHLIGQRAWLASRLTLEITESFPLDEIAGAAERLGQAKRLGCRLAIDDFGAGFAASAHLHGVDVDWDIVKVDRSCLGDLRKTPSGREGLLALVRLARCFAPVVVVEGIETRGHLALARASGASFGQGWMFDAAACTRWTALDGDRGERIAAAVMGRGAVLPPAFEPSDALRTVAAVGQARSRLLSRVDRLGDRVRALVARSRAGGVS